MKEFDVRLNLKDRKILFELEQNSRQSLQNIAKKVGLSKEAVFHRIKNLEKEGVIKKYITEIDIYKLEYQFYPILLKFQNITPKIEEEILHYLKNNEYVAWLTTCEGHWDINLTILAKSNFDLNLFLNIFLEKYSLYVAEKQIFVTTKIHYFKRGFWLNKTPTQTIGAGGEKVVKLEEQDLELLRLLSENARISIVKIAEKLNTTPKIISYKIKKLEKQKIIQGSRILVDFSKLNYRFYKIWFSLKNMNKKNWKRLLFYFQSNPNIIWTTKVIGYYDLSIEMEVKDVEEFRKILNEIKEKFSNLIKKHETLLIFEEQILNYLPKKQTFSNKLANEKKTR